MNQTIFGLKERDKNFIFELTKGDFLYKCSLYKCCGLLPLVVGAVLLGAIIVTGAVTYNALKYLLGNNSKETKSKLPYTMQ